MTTTVGHGCQLRRIGLLVAQGRSWHEMWRGKFLRQLVPEGDPRNGKLS